LFTEITQAKHDAVVETLADQPHQLICAVSISVANDVGESLVEAENHEVLLRVREICADEKFAHEVAHEAEISGMACEFNLASHWQPKTSSVRSSCGSVSPR